VFQNGSAESSEGRMFILSREHLEMNCLSVGVILKADLIFFFSKKPTKFKPRVATPLFGFSVRVPACLGASVTG
jgi:hypothetical protein